MVRTITGEGDQPRPQGWLQRVIAPVQAAFAWFKSPTQVPAEQEAEPVEEHNFDGMLAWSISSRLAAVPDAYLNQVPPEVAWLIRESKDLHPQMASRSASRSE